MPATGARVRCAVVVAIGLLGGTFVVARPVAATTASETATSKTAATAAGTSGRSAVEIQRNISYPTQGTATSTLDAYVVSGSAPGSKPAPAIVLVHGGGWQSGDKSNLAGIATAFAQAGFSSFSVDYRLAPTAPYPAAVTDVAAAVRWLREPAQVQRFAIDPARIGLFGVSAGGTLAAWVAMDGSGALDRDARVRAVATWSGPMALVKYAVRGTPATPGSSVAAYLGCEPRKCRSRAQDASPIAHVDGSDPPMLIANSRRELVPVDQARTMNVALAAAGVDHHILLFDGGRHAEQLAPVALAPTLRFYRDSLA
jgi:acetyl esterase/lipase